jgi:50S ribosomal protein L16 3-hydroxylase
MKTLFPGTVSVAHFLREHWQKKPLLVCAAFPAFAEPFTPRQVLGLAARDDMESRLVRRTGRKWELEHGPFAASRLARMPARNWSVLVQDTQHASRAAKALLQRFSFLPHARVDDLMVSFAKPGGGVGPHYDSYDVFLIQGTGRRRWRISGQRDLSLVPGAPLKILAHFKHEQEWVLEKGDMLYLPPGYAHDGVALEDCLTWSVGFRAPASQELATAFLDYLRDHIEIAGQYADPSLRATRHAGAIPAPMRHALKKTLRGIRWDDAMLEDFIGRYLSEPKQSVFFSAPDAPLPMRSFARDVRLHGVSLDLKTRLLYAGDRFFLNGESVAVPREAAALVRTLADHQFLPAAAVPAPGLALLYDWYLQGNLAPGK